MNFSSQFAIMVMKVVSKVDSELVWELIIDNDTLIFFNYRSDRVREIVQILYVDPSPLEGKVALPADISLFTMSK